MKTEGVGGGRFGRGAAPDQSFAPKFSGEGWREPEGRDLEAQVGGASLRAEMPAGGGQEQGGEVPYQEVPAGTLKVAVEVALWGQEAKGGSPLCCHQR